MSYVTEIRGGMIIRQAATERNGNLLRVSDLKRQIAEGCASGSTLCPGSKSCRDVTIARPVRLFSLQTHACVTLSI